MKNDKKHRGGRPAKASAENLPQRILRKIFHEGNSEAMEPRQIYDATVHAVMQEKGLTALDLDDVAREMMRLDRRAMLARERTGTAAMEIGLRASQEANVLEWAMDEIAAALRPGNRYGGK